MTKETKIVIANWKMKLGLPESLDLAKDLRAQKLRGDVEVTVCPSFVGLSEIGALLNKTKIKLGAQDCFWERQGAFTGEVSATYLREVGCSYVIVGHSERRQYLNETDEMVHKKIKMALAAGLTPIVCVGETFQQRQEGSQDYILINQTTKALEGIDVGLDQQVIIAYEPRWVIGSGRAIDPSQAELAHQIIRQSLFDIFPSSLINNNFSIIYGGSVDGNNVSHFTSLDNTAGVLVGNASLDAKEFVKIIQNV
ncbi:MAG: triose-phosphate isomerase [Patescibacteria group bacterium]|jgi:triosephosphate isomerase|nr:triose-phosphate isomerase [Patescibacteria group bacterium]